MRKADPGAGYDGKCSTTDNNRTGRDYARYSKKIPTR